MPIYHFICFTFNALQHKAIKSVLPVVGVFRTTKHKDNKISSRLPPLYNPLTNTSFIRLLYFIYFPQNIQYITILPVVGIFTAPLSQLCENKL